MESEILVLGQGPAGLAAAIAACGRGKRVLVAGNPWEQSPLAKAQRVDNYPGLPGLTGAELMERLFRHAQAMGAEFVTGRVVSLMAWEGFSLTAGSEVCSGQALVVAAGAVRTGHLPGELEFLGRGVSCCATCDGMLYRNRPVVVVGLCRDAPQEANYLSGIGCQVVYVSPREPQGLNPEIPVVRAGNLEIQGGPVVTGLMADGVLLPCDGIFVLREAVAATDLLPQLEVQKGAIVVDRAMATNLTGVFAAGDCTGAPLQVSKAVGEGHVAGLSAADYLEQKKHSVN